VTVSVICGRNAAVGAIVFTSSPAMLGLSGISNSMVSSPAAALASWMASLSVQTTVAVEFESHVPSGFVSPVLPVELTVKVVSAWAGLAARSRPNNSATRIPSPKDPFLPTRIALEAVLVVSCSLLVSCAPGR
jgi:hypothetical protein